MSATKPPFTLRRVDWLAEILDLTIQQTYYAISTGNVPERCIHKVGRLLRVKEEAVLECIQNGEIK